jgi:uncharacterized protein involved in exopolysaccharide biosynthesis
MIDEIEIDLRQVIRTLLRSSLWIVGAAVLLGLAAFLFSRSQPKEYMATAVVTINRDRFQPDFNTDSQNLPVTMVNTLVTDIAKSDEIAYAVYQARSGPAIDFNSFVKNYLITKEGANTSVVYLSVRLDSPEEASKLANLWAQLVVDKINANFSNYNQDQLTFFEAQVVEAKRNMQAAEQALIEFESRNEVESLTNQINNLLGQQREVLGRKRSISYLQRDGQTFLDQIKGMSDTDTLPSGEYINLIVLQLRLYGDATATNLSSFQLQLNGVEGGRPITVAEARSSFQDLQTAMEIQSAEVDTLLAEYPRNLADLQKRIETLKQEEDRLRLEKELTQDSYSTIIKKYEEVKVGIPDVSKISTLTSRSVPPVVPEDANILRNTVLGMMAGALLAALVVLARAWWVNGLQMKSNS